MDGLANPVALSKLRRENRRIRRNLKLICTEQAAWRDMAFRALHDSLSNDMHGYRTHDGGQSKWEKVTLEEELGENCIKQRVKVCGLVIHLGAILFFVSSSYLIVVVLNMPLNHLMAGFGRECGLFQQRLISGRWWSAVLTALLPIALLLLTVRWLLAVSLLRWWLTVALLGRLTILILRRTVLRLLLILALRGSVLSLRRRSTTTLRPAGAVRAHFVFRIVGRIDGAKKQFDTPQIWRQIDRWLLSQHLFLLLLEIYNIVSA